jgi:hypothetical protein
MNSENSVGVALSRVADGDASTEEFAARKRVLISLKVNSFRSLSGGRCGSGGCLQADSGNQLSGETGAPEQYSARAFGFNGHGKNNPHELLIGLKEQKV